MYTYDPNEKFPSVFTVEHEKLENGEIIRRNQKEPEKLVSDEWTQGGNCTLYDTIMAVCKKWPGRDILGKRTLIGIETIDKKVAVPNATTGPRTSTSSKNSKRSKNSQEFVVKKWKCNKLSSYAYTNYKTMWEQTNLIGRGLLSKEVGLSPGDVLQIFAPTSMEWILTAISCIRQSIEIATAYDTLGLDALVFSAGEADAKVLFTRIDMVGTAAKVAERVDALTTVIYYGGGEFDKFDPKVPENFKVAEEAITKIGKRLISIENVIDLGKKDRADHPDAENDGDHPPTPEDKALIMYTSGTTGNPKGVVIKHKNISALIGGVQLHLLGHFEDGDVLIAYLPLAHILEFAVEFTCLSLGVVLGYGSPRTLTTSMVRGCLGDLEELKPTLMAGVPQVWNGIARELISQVKSKGPIVSAMFNAALKFKWSRMEKTPKTNTWMHESFLFSKPKKIVGGRLKFALSGGAAIASETQKMLSCILCPIIQGYGMTESCGVIALQQFQTFGLHKTGPIIPSIEAKLVSVPDAGYLTENNQGEIWVRGPSVSSGYLCTPEGDETFTEDGWLRTGDVGEWKSDGQLSIIDRVKNLVKLANGEYIALEQLESLYVTSPYTANVCLHVKQDQNQPIAIVCLNEKLAERLAQSSGLDKKTDIPHLAHDEQAIHLVMTSLLEVAKKNKFIKPQTVSGVIIDEVEWTPENGVLTAASKVQRRVVVKRLADRIEELYKSM